jgi:hypothetical protein
MAKPCFMKKDTSPPTCGVHGVPLVRHQSSDESATANLGNFALFMCPVSGIVVRESATH